MRHAGRFLIAFCFLLTACGGGGKDNAACERGYFRDDVGTACLPAGWEPLSEELFLSYGVPEETVMAFEKEGAVAGQFPAVAVTRERLRSGVDTEEYSEATIRSVTLLPSYSEIDVRPVDGFLGKLMLHIYSAQLFSGQPVRRFYQVSAVSPDGVGYTFTAVTPLAVERDLEQEVINILRNITFEGPEDAEG